MDMRWDQTVDAREVVGIFTRRLKDPHMIRAGLAVSAWFGCGAPPRRQPQLRVMS